MKGKKLNRVFFPGIKEINKILRKQGAHSEQPSSTVPASSPEPAREAHSLLLLLLPLRATATPLSGRGPWGPGAGSPLAQRWREGWWEIFPRIPSYSPLHLKGTTCVLTPPDNFPTLTHPKNEVQTPKNLIKLGKVAWKEDCLTEQRVKKYCQ